MLPIYWIALIVLLLLHGTGESIAEELPSWITNDPAFQKPTEVDSIKNGNGSIWTKEKGSRGWLVFLNERAGHGIEFQVNKLSLNPDSGDFLLLSTWPLTAEFKQVKLFTGKFEKPLTKIRIPNAKIFFLLYKASQTTAAPEMAVEYRRYGISLELNPLPTENPAKKKEIVYEVQLKGKPPEEYSAPDFLSKVKEGIRAAAHRYSTANNITFNQDIPTEEMVFIHKVTFCPFEWPDRHICASLKHSVFVSGLRIPDEEIILDYQLTADNLKMMWNKENFPELQQLGVAVYLLPPTNSTIIYWTLIIGLVILSSLVIGCIFWKANINEDTSLEENERNFEEVKKVRKEKLKPSKHQRIPSFMLDAPPDGHVNKYKESALSSGNEERPEDVFKAGVPMKNYFGSILFGANRAFEDDEDKVAETPSKSPLVKQTFQ